MKNPMMFTPTVLIILCSLLPLSVRSQQVVFEEKCLDQREPAEWKIETEFKPKKGAANLPEGLSITEWMGWSFADHAW